MLALQAIDPNELRRFVERIADAAYWQKVSEWGYDLFFVAFVVGAVLLLAFCFLPEYAGPAGPIPPAPGYMIRQLGRRRWQLGHIGLILLLILCCISQQTGVDWRRGFIADQDKRYEKAIRKLAAHKNKEEVLRAEYLYMPEGNSMAYLSLGNTGLAADYLWLTSQQYVFNSFRRGSKFQLLLRFYDTILDLDPHWVEAAVNGGKVLSALEPNRYAVEKFYIKAIMLNPDSWRLPEEAGRLFVVPPLDPEQRKDYSRRATQWFNDVLRRLEKLPKSQAVDRKIMELEDITGRLALESGAGYYEVSADMLLKRARDPNSPKASRAAAAREFLGAQSMVIATRLQSAVKEWQSRQGSFPPNLIVVMQSLRDKRGIGAAPDGWPLDTYGLRLDYDPAKGNVSSRGFKARRAIQAKAIVNGLIEMYRNNHGSEVPKDLQQLQQFVREFFGGPNNPPGPAITDAIGADLNVLINPLGEPWDFNPAAGKVNLPDFADPKVLFRNAERIMNE